MTDEETKATRDVFAMGALTGMLAHSTRYKPRPVDAGLHWHQAIAREAYQIADAMLREREKSFPPASP